jgi:hypothetical protein
MERASRREAVVRALTHRLTLQTRFVVSAVLCRRELQPFFLTQLGVLQPEHELGFAMKKMFVEFDIKRWPFL